jgi:SAM-dependent methyltransferase
MGGRQRARLVYATKSLARRLRWAIPDTLEGASRDGGLAIPRGIAFVGKGDFEKTGHEYLDLFKHLGSLEPNQRVLDIGCGIGRMAIPLLGYLDEVGSYSGFDVGKAMVKWCQKEITSRRSDFEFVWAPVYNRKYNPYGRVSGEEFKFPYPDSSFDFVFATSLFTHLTLSDSTHYLEEINRVLRPGGRTLLTFFILRPQSLSEIEAGRAALDFRYPTSGGLTIDRREPEAAMAFDLDVLEARFAQAGLRICEPINFGLWAKNPNGVAGQDIVVAERP